MSFIKLVGNRVALWMDLVKADGSRPVLGTDMKPGPDYQWLEIPYVGKKKKFKAGELVTLPTNMAVHPHRSHVMIEPNPALVAAGEVRCNRMVGDGDTATIEVLFRPDLDYDLTNLPYLVRLYLMG